MGMNAVVFDLGGTHLRCGLGHDSGAVSHAAKQRIRTRADGHEPAAVWHDIVRSVSAYVAAMQHDAPPLAPVVLAFPGPITHGHRIVAAPTLVGPDHDIPDLAADLQRRTGRPVHLINDLSAAAWHVSRLVAAPRFIVVTVGSGVGSKVFDRRHPARVLDDQVYGGEIGHAKVDLSPDAVMCDCGGTGHLGAIASGRGIERAARRAAHRDPDGFRRSMPARLGATAACLTNEDHLVPAVLARDPWTCRLVRHCTRPMAQILLVAALASGLQKAVVVGGFALACGDVYREILQEAVLEACDYDVMRASVADLVELGDAREEAGLLGAAVYAAERLRASS